jgi:hypothetical protein
MAAAAAVCAAELREALQVLINELVHPAAQQLCQRLTRALPIVLHAVGLHGLHRPKRGW